MLILCREKTAHKYDWQSLCVLSSWAVVGCDPRIMGLGPVHHTSQRERRQPTPKRLALFHQLKRFFGALKNHPFFDTAFYFGSFRSRSC